MVVLEALLDGEEAEPCTHRVAEAIADPETIYFFASNVIVPIASNFIFNDPHAIWSR